MEKYGPFAPMVGYALAALGAFGALVYAFKGRLPWDPCDEDLPRGPRRTAAILSAVGTILIWTFFDDRDSLLVLGWITAVSAGIALLGLFLYMFVLAVWVYVKERVQNGTVQNERIIGGFVLTRDAREAIEKARRARNVLTVQDVFKGSAYDPDKVWPRPARAIVKLIFAIAYLLLIVGAVVALGSGGRLVELGVKSKSKTAMMSTAVNHGE